MPIHHPASWKRLLRCLAVASALLSRAALADAPSDGPPAAQRLVLLTAADVAAIPQPAQAPPAAQQPVLGRRRHILGLQLDAGVPDLAGASIIYRPWSYLRFTGGMLYNVAGYGVRGGVSLVPYFFLAPSLNLEGGYYFDANAYEKLRTRFTIDDSLKPLLQKVGYSFVNASLGLELGHPDWFVFFVRAGISKVWLRVQNANEALSTVNQTGSTVLTHIDDPSVKLGIPNVKLGFMIFFY
jgi:hypothetical protein